jgi:hypothetical protein
MKPCNHNWELIKGIWGKWLPEQNWYYHCSRCGETKKYNTNLTLNEREIDGSR